MNPVVSRSTERQIGVEELIAGPSQPSAVSRVIWRTMKYFRRKPVPRKNATSHRRRFRGELPLRTASLGSPIFVESWNGGSPLNWIEFMGRWENRRSDSAPVESAD